MTKYHFFISLCFLFLSVTAVAQKTEKYPSLLWEISGNGMLKPSYLFGTMHVSNKLVFHLSDSFYNAIKSTEAVALELNPELWQDQMVRMDKLKENYQSFVKIAGNDYLHQNSFRINDYLDELKLALQSEPAVVNSLLYRSYKSKEDFEEDTFLDLYIFQTGRKLGKKAAGVENYYESEKIVLEAYADMAKEKNKRSVDIEAESMNDIVQKMQNAYRRGDLDLMDSLDLLMERSDAFREKFLYKRNDIQANSIDSIIRNTSLFVGVGAAHLPGNRGVIELLRKKGYILRPVKMADRDAVQKSIVDDLRVPVVFKRRYSEDLVYSVEVPGDLYKVSQDDDDLNRKQYADMSNGSYYMVTRVKTYAAFLNQSEKNVLKKIDSMLYENIPGKILSKTNIIKNNYDGFDITSKTRRGDLQRYQIFVTPFEIIIFKMSGKEDYTSGEEARCFFSSVILKERSNSPVEFQPLQGGFSMRLPQEPVSFLNKTSTGDRWEYEAIDKTTGNAYLLMKKTIYNYNFIDEDSFDLGLAEASFHNPELFVKQISRRQVTVNGQLVLEVKEKLKDSSIVDARYFINGPHYYVLAVRNAKQTKAPDEYLHSFLFKPFKYPEPTTYVDTFLRSSVMSPVVPELDASMRKLVEQALDDAANGNNASGYISYWPKVKRGVFRSEATGEMMSVKVHEYPVYYYIRDSAKFWQNEINELLEKQDMFISGKMERISGKDYTGVRFSIMDTGSSRKIDQLLILKNNYLYNITGVSDTVNVTGTFISTFFENFEPWQVPVERNLYMNTLKNFFNDLFSKDSAVQNKAQQSIANVYYGVPGIPLIMDAITRVSMADKKYFDTKTRLISELGFIKDSTSDMLVENLKKIYEQTADTALFQNEVVKALARLKTKSAYHLLKEILLQDPPIFENDYEYTSMFENLEDSLQLTAGLFPELLRLGSLDDYKEKVFDLFANLVDSGLVKPKNYKSVFPNIYVDAKIALKKQLSRDEKKMRTESKTNDNEEPARLYNNYNDKSASIQNYSILLMPFYEKDKNVKSFFSRLLQSNDGNVRLNTAVLLIRKNKVVADSILLSLAADDKYRADLLYQLETTGHSERFPKQFKTQEYITRSFLTEENKYDKLDSMVFLEKRSCTIKRETGYIYFYKYRVKKEHQWKIGITGLQPLNTAVVNADDDLSLMTEVRLKDDEPVSDQLDAQLKKILYIYHKSAKVFFRENGGNY
ncbi:MAG: TraB/GumN family protein [Ferruginibacter sp.]|nr:TraB/GumN family protein [Ferruginibacter sp.]